MIKIIVAKVKKLNNKFQLLFSILNLTLLKNKIFRTSIASHLVSVYDN